ncbi:MAG: choice-of-anchor D domain-containing protein [Myxococcales bacterium]|nr:choice-of-anchor D domain-containing protein [Myxococcales bacterium]
MTPRPDLRTNDSNGATLAAIDFTACPNRDENNQAVRDVFPDAEPVVLSNLTGRAPAKAKFTFSGADADAFQLRVAGGDAGAFTVVTVPYELDITTGEEITFEVAFAPKKKGAHSATLTIDDQDAETKTDPVITLIGTGLDLPSQPTLETGVQMEDGGFTVCEQGSIFTDCELGFPLVQFETTITKKIRIKNKGCPALKISAIKVGIDTLGTESPDFKLVSPASPSIAAPISLNKADGTDTIEATIEFKPTDTGPGNETKSGFIIVDSNDPVNMAPISAPGVLSLRGEGLRPALSATPTSCDYSRMSDNCGNSPKIADRARFIVRNDGNAQVRISDVKFKSSGMPTSGQSGRFNLAMNPTGTTINPGMSITLEVTHNDMPLYVIDELQLKSVFVAGDIPSGDVSFALFGGRQPCLDTLDEVNFNNPQTPMSAQSFFIGNTRRLSDGGTDSSQCGTLVINQVGIDPSMFFSIIDPRIAPNTSVPPGMRVETAIQYNRPPSGGMQVGKLKILSNDPFFGPPAGTKEINIISASPFDPPPIAVLKGCIPAQLLSDPNCSVSGTESQMTVQLSMISQSPKTMTVSGFDSTDSDGMTMGKPREYRFQLLAPFPQGASAMSVTPNTRGMVDKAVVALPGPGLYRINLTVWDSRGQQGQPVSLNVNVIP